MTLREIIELSAHDNVHSIKTFKLKSISYNIKELT